MLLADIDLTAVSGTYIAEPIAGLGAFYSAATVCQYTQIGGTSCTISIETSIDEGLTWIDIARYALTSSGNYAASTFSITNISAPAVYTPLANNTQRLAFAGDRLRAAITPTGTFTTGSRIAINYFPRYRWRNGLHF